MPGVTEMGMVWMGAGQQSSDLSMGMISRENGDMMMDHDSPYFTPSHHSASNHSLEDLSNVHGSPMVSCCYFILKDTLYLLASCDLRT